MRYILLSSSAGIIFGLGAIALKLLTNEFSFIFLFLVGITALFGIVIFQYSLKYQKASITAATSAGFSSVVAVIGGMFLGELLTTMEMAGVILVISGSVLLLAVKG